MKLKPCPFCGGTAHFLEREKNNFITIFCEKASCGAEILHHCDMTKTKHIKDLSIKHLIKSWEKRI